MIEFIPVHRGAEQRMVVELADEIWNEYYPAIIGQEQTTYMLDKFQSLAAIKQGMDYESHDYWLITSDEAGYTGYTTEEGRNVIGYACGYMAPIEKRYYISKVYLQKPYRGKGYMVDIERFLRVKAMGSGMMIMSLRTNKKNEQAIAAYKSVGFEIIDEIQTDIGEGFMMDDYVMEKSVF